jgi:Cu/Ag efflux pump CusA
MAPNVPRAAHSRRSFFFAVACGFALGCVSFATAPQSVFPAISLARVEVFADAGDLMPEQVRTSVADPLEAAFASIPGVRATRAYSDQGKLEIELDFEPRGDVAKTCTTSKPRSRKCASGSPSSTSRR